MNRANLGRCELFDGNRMNKVCKLEKADVLVMFRYELLVLFNLNLIFICKKN